MIYLQKGTSTNALTAIAGTENNAPTDDMQWLKNYTPPLVNARTAQEIDQFKQHKAVFFIAGKMTIPTRNNGNLISRSLLIIDFDSIQNKSAFLDQINRLFYRVEYDLYPSISYGFKGIRYRLILMPNRSYNEIEYKIILDEIQNRMKVQFDSNAIQWSQVMGLPITNRLSILLYQSGRIHNAGKSFNVDEIINQGGKTKLTENENSIVPDSQSVTELRTSKPPFSTKILNDLNAPIEEGNRNAGLTSYCGKLFALRGLKSQIVYELLTVKNSYCSPPLDDHELNKIFRSIAKREQQKRGVIT